MKGSFFRLALRGIALGLLAGIASGCIGPSQISKRITTAPNLQNRPVSLPADEWYQSVYLKENPFRPVNILVGPPEAVLSVEELPAADYKVELVSKVTLKPKGGGDLFVKLMRETNAPAEPLPIPQRGTVVLLHGYGMQKETMAPWAFVLAQSGYRVVLVDLRGHGRSTGDTFSCGKYEAPDLVQMLNYLQAQRGYQGPIGVLGISFGADLALLWAARDPRIQTVVAIAPYNRPDDAMVRLAKEMGIPLSAGALHKGADLAATRLGVDWSDLSGGYAVRHLTQPVLFVGGGKDAISPPNELNALETLAPHGSDCLMVPQANHYVVGYWFDQVEKPVTHWFDAHLAVALDSKQGRQSAAVQSAAGN